MIDLPSLLLSYGVSLRQRGNEYQCLCFAHDDHNPSMAVYINGTGKHVAHCYSCGFHEDAIGTYCWFNDLDPKNPSHFLQAKNALESGNYHTGKPYAVIHNDLPPPEKRTERTMLLPLVGHDLPKMGWLKTREGVPFGEPCEIYTYRQPDGKPWYYEARWMVPDEHGELHKECRCFTYGKRGAAPAKWECSHHLPPRPLYGMDMLAKLPNAQVVICEGPRKALAAQALLPSLPCVGWAGGANGCNKSDWTPLAGRRCLLWPDADAAGRKAMVALAQVLIALGCEEVRIFNTADMPDKWDAADAVAEGWDTARTIAWAKEHKGEMVTADAEVTAAVEAVEAVEAVADPSLPDPDGSMYEYGDEPVFDGEIPVQEKPVSATPQKSENEMPANVAASIPIETYRDSTSEHVWTAEPADLFGEYIVPGLKPDMLPKVVQDFVDDRAYIINTEPAYGALCCIVTASGMIDDRIRIKVKADEDWFESARLWGCIVGEPSSRKSPMQRQVVGPIKKLIEKVAKEDAEIAANQEILDAKYEKKWKEYKAACIDSDDYASIERPVPPPRPERHHVKVRSFTIEGLEEVLRDCPRGVFVDVDELSGLIGSLDAYKSNGSKKDRAQILEAYEGGPYQKSLVGRGNFTIPNFSATILGGIQPSKMRQVQIDLSGDGFLQRFLVVCSASDGGNDRDDPPNVAAIKAWSDLIDSLYHIKPGSHYVAMTQESRTIWRDATDVVHKIINTRMIGPAFTSHLGKYNGIAARMILTYHCIESVVQCRHPESWPVSADTASKAMRYLMNHLLPHAVSFYEDGLGQSETQECAKLIAGQIVAAQITELKTTWMHQHAPGKWRNGSTQLQADSLNRLVEYGWIQPVGGVNNATRRPTRYLVNPHVHDLFKKHKEAELTRMNNARELGRKIRAGEIKGRSYDES